MNIADKLKQLMNKNDRELSAMLKGALSDQSTKQQLQNILNNHNNPILKNALSNLSDQDLEQLKNIANNPEKVKEIIQSKDALEQLKKMVGD